MLQVSDGSYSYHSVISSADYDHLYKDHDFTSITTLLLPRSKGCKESLDAISGANFSRAKMWGAYLLEHNPPISF